MKYKMHFITYFISGVFASILIKKCLLVMTDNINLALIASDIWSIWSGVAIAHDIYRNRRKQK